MRVAGIRHDQVNRLVHRRAHDPDSIGSSAGGHPSAKNSGCRRSKCSMIKPPYSSRANAPTRSLISSCRSKTAVDLQALPQRSRGDVILDLEGHPFFEPARGLTFLFGVLTIDGDKPRYDHSGRTIAPESVAPSKTLSILFMRALAQHPDLHVYHFGAYEQSAIKQLMGQYATREAEVDDLLRRKIFVNLYSIFRQALRAGVVELFAQKTRTAV